MNKFSNNASMCFTNYNVKLKHRRTRAQWAIRVCIISAIVIFVGGFINEFFFNLTGLNSTRGVVSAAQDTTEFNPVKMILNKERKMTEADYILVGNLMRVRLAIKQMEECAVHSNEIAEYGLTKEEVTRVLDKLRAMDSQLYLRVEERWGNTNDG